MAPKISPAEKPVRDIRIQGQFLAFTQIGVAVVVGISSQDFAGQALLAVAQALEILQGPVQHGRLHLGQCLRADRKQAGLGV